MYSFFPQ